MTYEQTKRVSDIVLASLAVIILAPLLIIVSLIIKLDSPGPILFRQKRFGKNKTIFMVYKFRTMYMAAPKNTPTHEFYNAHSYITRVGRFLRKLSIDELPQLINVVRGHMSLVGPRPVVLAETALINEREKYGANTLKPGITGWAQVNGRDELRMERKAKMDGEYTKNFGILIDIQCILLTLSAVLSIKGHREGHELGDIDDASISAKPSSSADIMASEAS